MRRSLILIALVFLVTFFATASNRVQSPLPPQSKQRQVEVNAKRWTKVVLPALTTDFHVHTDSPIRVKCDDGREFQLLAGPQKFTLPNGESLKTAVMKISGRERSPVENFGPEPTRILYLRAESEKAKVDVKWEEGSGLNAPAIASSLDKCLAAKDRLERLNSELLRKLDLSNRTIEALGKAKGNPESLLALAKSSQQGIGSDTLSPTTFEESGRVHVVRELVIGTLSTEYDKDVSAGNAVRLKAVFKPHPILNLDRPGGATEDTTTWYTEMQYASEKNSVIYDERQSGGKPARRELTAGTNEETWVWNITPRPNFKTDVSDLILFAGYKKGDKDNRTDVLHESVKLSEVEAPGFLMRTVHWSARNVTPILAAVTACLAIFGTILGLKNAKLQAFVTELEIQLKKLDLRAKSESPAAGNGESTSSSSLKEGQ